MGHSDRYLKEIPHDGDRPRGVGVIVRSSFYIVIKIYLFKITANIICNFRLAFKLQFELQACYTGNSIMAEHAWAKCDPGEV